MSKYPVPPRNPIENGSRPDPENVKTWEWFIFIPVLGFAAYVICALVENLLH